MKISIHAGHGKSKSRGAGACGYCDESEMARKIIESMKKYWNDDIAFNDCTINSSLTQREILTTLVKRINDYAPDFAVSIHLNSSDNIQAQGVECLVHSKTTDENKLLAKYIVDDLSSAFGFNNRGVKFRDELYILRKTCCPTIIVEVGFCTNYKDSKILMSQFDAIGACLAVDLSGVKVEKSKDKNSNKKYTVKVHNVNESTAKKLTDIAYEANAVYQKDEV